MGAGGGRGRGLGGLGEAAHGRGTWARRCRRGGQRGVGGWCQDASVSHGMRLPPVPVACIAPTVPPPPPSPCFAAVRPQGVLSSAAEVWPHIAISDSLVMADTAVRMAEAGCT